MIEHAFSRKNVNARHEFRCPLYQMCSDWRQTRKLMRAYSTDDRTWRNCVSLGLSSREAIAPHHGHW